MRNLTRKILAVLAIFALVTAVSCGPGKKKDDQTDTDPVQTTAERAEAVGFLKSARRYIDENDPPKYALACQMYYEAIEADPTLFPAHLGYQDSFFKYFDAGVPSQAKERDKMKKMYASYAKRHKDSAEFQYLYGAMLDKCGEPIRAAKYYRAALKLDYTLYQAHLALADVCEKYEKSPSQTALHRKEGEKFRMVCELEEAVERKPFDIVAHRNRQDAMLLMENEEPAHFPPGATLERYRKLMEKHAAGSRDATFRYLYGRLLGQAGQTEDAQKQFETARTIRPKLAWPNDGLAAVYVNLANNKPLDESEKQISKAVRLSQKSVTLDPKQIDFRLRLLQLRQMLDRIYAMQARKLSEIERRGGLLSKSQEEKRTNYSIKIHNNRMAFKTEAMETVSQYENNPRPYFALGYFAYSDGAFLFAREVAGIAKSLAGSMTGADAKLNADLIEQTKILKEEADRAVKELISGKRNVMARTLLIEESRRRLKDENAELRKRTVSMLTQLCVAFQAGLDSLPEALRADYRNRIKQSVVLIAGALDDKDPDVIVEAVRSVGALQIDPFADKVAAILADKKAEPRLRMEAAIAVKSMRTKSAVPALIGGLEADNADVRKFSAEALVAIVGRSHGYNHDDTPENRSKAVEKWKKWWEENKQSWGTNEK